MDPYRLSYSTAGITLGVAVSVALIASRTPSLSPLTILLFSPGLLLGGGIVFAAAHLWLTWWTERLVLGKYEQLKREAGELGTGFSGVAGQAPAFTTKAASRRSVPPLVFTSPAAWSVLQTRASWESSTTSHRPPFPLATPALSTSLDDLFDLILRDFVLKWYSTISDSPSFPNAVERTMRETLAELAGRAATLDWSDVIVGKILPLVTKHVDTFRTAEAAMRGQNPKAQLTESDELDLFLASRYATELGKGGKLHPAVDVASPNSRPAEEAWLSSAVGKLLPLVMPGREVESGVVRVIVREIVACSVLLPVVELLSDPDFWNRMIDDKAGAAIRDQKMVDQFRQALDAQDASHLSLPTDLKRRTSSVRRSTRKAEEISARTDLKQFATFVKGIGKCNSLLDARRLRSDVTSQIRKTQSLVDGRGKDEFVDGQKVADLLNYIDRLYSAKRKADHRIQELGGFNETGRIPTAAGASTGGEPRLGLRDVLLQPTSLSYFTEFQDRRRRSLRVQFWLLVEGLKDPLEDVDDSDDNVAAQYPATSEATDTTREDMHLIWDVYFTTNALNAKQRHVKAVERFLENPGTVISVRDLRSVRKAVFSAQSDVFTEMEEEDFPEFVKSDLYFKALTDLPEPTSSPNFDVGSFHPPPSPPLTSARKPSPYQHRDTSAPRSPSPSRRPTLPSLPFQSGQSLTLLSTHTAPPKVTLKAAFDSRPAVTRRVGSDGIIPSQNIAPHSPTASISSLTDLGAGRRSKTALSDSLDFLMSPPPTSAGEDEGARSPLFEDHSGDADGDSDRGGGTALSEDDYIQVQTIEAIQEALNSILETDARSSSKPNILTARKPTPPSVLQPAPQPKVTPLVTGKQVSTPPLTPKTRDERRPSGSRVFEDGEGDRELDEDDGLEEPEFDITPIRLASPGDLQLPVEIARLETQIEKYQNQEAVVEALIRKAELTGNASELKILVKSRDSLRREIKALSFQKAQYETQSENNKLVPGRTVVSISGTTVGQTGGQSFQLYLVEVHQLATDGSFASGWIVTRRYSEFASLHAKLKERYPAARQLDIPSKRLVTPYSDGFIEHRKAGLEKYLQALIRIPIICQSHELRFFLSQQNISLPHLDSETGKRNASYFPGQSLVRSFYRSVTSGIDEIFTAGPSSMMDTVIQRLSQQAAELSGVGGAGVQDEDLVGQILAGKAMPTELKGSDEGLTYFTAPICDLFVTLFELKEKNNWLRRQAIVIILQQVLGGTIERKFRDGVTLLKGPEQLISYIASLKNALWPGGQLKPKVPPRTASERANSRESANKKLSALMPDIAASLIGRTNARQGARRLFAVLQNRRLNRHLIYMILDEFLEAMFPELIPPPVPTATAAGRGRNARV